MSEKPGRKTGDVSLDLGVRPLFTDDKEYRVRVAWRALQLWLRSLEKSVRDGDSAAALRAMRCVESRAFLLAEESLTISRETSE